MNADIEIWLPVDPFVIMLFFGIIVVALIYYGIKFVVTLVLGG